MKHNGWRKPTPGLSAAEKHAQAGEQLSVPKNRAFLAYKRVAACLGLKPSDMLLLDTFGAFTKSQDWEEGRRPIVWASNTYLMQQTGFSLSALKRHAKRLSEAGLIAFKDSANGKRWGHRDDQGYIIEAYGYDLAPMAARTVEFERQFAAIQEERALCKSIKTKITITRRVIRSKLEQAVSSVLKGPWRELGVAFEDALSKLPRRNETPERLLDILDWFHALKERVEQAFDAAFAKPDHESSQKERKDRESAQSTQKLNPTGSADGPHLLDTNQLHPETSNIYGERKARRPSDKLPPSVEVERSQKEQGLDFINWGSKDHRGAGTEVDLSTVMAACPSFAEMARDLGGYVRDWNEFHRAAGQIRPICGISEDAWNKAQETLGPLVAAAAIALIFDKHTAGEVESPGGYLRGMVGKALNGELNLDRSFYGRLNEVRAVH